MTPNPILKVLSTLTSHQVRYLLMGGQACVLYGGAEFSRDTDIAVVADSGNLARLQAALDELQADCIAVPPFAAEFLDQGLAVHFRCRHPDALGMRVDVMSVMRGVAPFEELWHRRTTLELASDVVLELLAMPDLVQSKKTQRDKDWPMIRRLVEASYRQSRDEPSEEHIEFWLRECRTPEILVTLAGQYPQHAAAVSRELLAAARTRDFAKLAHLLAEEEEFEREADREYWAPRRKLLGQLRHQRRRT